jgi:hypothetical protein
MSSPENIQYQSQGNGPRIFAKLLNRVLNDDVLAVANPPPVFLTAVSCTSTGDLYIVMHHSSLMPYDKVTRRRAPGLAKRDTETQPAV